MKFHSSIVRIGASLALAILFIGNSRADTTVTLGTFGQFGDPTDLDLIGEFPYAINFSPNDPPLTVNGVTFTPDTTPPVGTSFVGPNNVAPWQTRPDFGPAVDNMNLGQIMEDIRWANSAAGQLVEAHLPVTVGETYKLQILFYGNHQEDRRWDIEVEGELAVDGVTSLGPTEPDGSVPIYSPTVGVVYTYQYTAADPTLDVRMGQIGGLTEGIDTNAIWQALTVEHVLPDSDGDNLPDAWEIAHFGNLAQTATGDPDGDGLNNLGEYLAGSDPKVADTDGDGLSDGDEVLDYHTNPTLADTDGDTLSDGYEINISHSDPTRKDTDGDGLSDDFEVNTSHTNPSDPDTDGDSYTDGVEVAAGTNPSNAASFPLYSSAVVPITGGDKKEGLDLDGNFVLAARFGNFGNVGPWQVRDAQFVAFDTIPNLTQDAINVVDPWVSMSWPQTTADDASLVEVMRSIRYNGPMVHIDVAGLLTSGKSYKVQLLFAEACCNNRGYDVYIQDTLVANEFAPGPAQGGASGAPARGTAVVYGFLATGTDLHVRLDHTTVTTPGLTDGNCIINAMTVEEIPPAADLDADGLPDTWEVQYFGDTSHGPGEDFDHDGLTNLQELTANTDPTKADTDGDGLNDGQEVNVYHSDPRVADTDGDGLSDGVEVNTSHTDPTIRDTDGDGLDDGEEVNTQHTNPLLADSDGDGVNDFNEVFNGSDPNDASSHPVSPYIVRYTGGDIGEGLDLDGTFLYAFNVGTNGAPGLIRDADFTDDAAPGITVMAPNEIPNFDNTDFGSTTNDDRLEMVTNSIRWADAANADPSMQQVTVTLQNLIPGTSYKMQLLFGEGCCPFRAFDIRVNGSVIVHEFNTAPPQGGQGNPRAGSAIVYEFVATSSDLLIELDGRGVTNPVYVDHNAILSGVTIEQTSPPLPPSLNLVSRTVNGGGATVALAFTGVPGHSYSIDHSVNLAVWEEVTDAATPGADGKGTYSDSVAARTTLPLGYYRLRDPTLRPNP